MIALVFAIVKENRKSPPVDKSSYLGLKSPGMVVGVPRENLGPAQVVE